MTHPSYSKGSDILIYSTVYVDTTTYTLKLKLASWWNV